MAGQQRRIINRLILATVLVVSIGVVSVGSYLLSQPAPVSVLIIGGVATALAFIMLLLAFAITRRLFDDIDRLRGDILVAASGLRGLPPTWSAKPDQTDELIRLSDAVIDFGAKGQVKHNAVKERLATVIGCLDQPVLLVTHSGIISEYNKAAETLFGDKALHLGASVFSLLDAANLRTVLHAMDDDTDHPLTPALPLAASLDEAQPCLNTRLKPLADGGFVLVIHQDLDNEPRATANLATKSGAKAPETGGPSQPDRLPVDQRIGDDTPLSQLAVTVFDCETTGLNTLQDRMVSFGTLRMTGVKQYPLSAMDVVINPGQPIPPLATSIHGITDTVVAHAPNFAEVWPQLAPQLTDTVLVGHHIAFDVGFIERELGLAGLNWAAPKLLDTARLVRLLKGLHHDPSLDEVAALYGLNLIGRHSALGDTLLTASLYARLLEDCQAAGIITFGGLRDSLSAGRLLVEQTNA
ncbi:MAG: exonuclease domain-containing protein [Pseudomonadota bacterium]